MPKEKIVEISISGYKSISPDFPVNIKFEKVNILLGANGSGKTNIISFFKMLNSMIFGEFQRFVETVGTSQVFLHNGKKYTQKVEGKLHFKSETHINRYEFELTPATPDRLIINSEKIEWGNKDRKLQVDLLESNFKESALANDTADDTIRIIRKILQRCKVYQFHDSSNESHIRQSSHIDINNFLQAKGNNLASFLYRLKEEFPSNYNRILSYIRLIMSQFKDFYFDPNGKGYVSLKWMDIFSNDNILLPEQFSDGSIRFIALATLLLQPPTTIPNIIIIDEPELGLHPFAIVQLAEMIKEASKHTQVIIATQSPGLVNEFEADQITVIEAENGYSTAQRLDKEELKDWLEHYSISELWDKNVLGGRP